MIIKEIFEQLVTSEHPVAKALHSGEHFRVLAIGFKSGMKLKEHQARMPSKLTVLTGEVIYSEGEKKVKLEQYDEVNIPVNTLHSVEAVQDSLCLLTQG